MIGFFEHQYLKFKKSHLSLLAALATADGHLHEFEIKFLHKIGRKYGLKPKHIESVLAKSGNIEPDIPIDYRRRLDQMYDLVGMMLADGVIEEREMKFCKEIAEKFGFKEDLVETLVDVIEARDDDEQWENFKEKFKENLAR